MSRAIVCHYHIFKNSGTTFERVLDDNYGEAHIRFDGPFSYFNINQDQLCNIIDRNPNAQAVSSHQIHLPVPSSTTFRAIPVVFVRHPLLRIRSVFQFNTRAERELDKEAGRDPLEAFDPWLQSMLASRNNRLLLSNVQTNMLSRPYNGAPRSTSKGGRLHYDLYTAVANLRNVPCLGRTECFDTDVKRFESELAEFGLDFHYAARDAENVTSGDYRLPIDTQLSKLRDAISGDNWQMLEDLNSQDLELYGITERLIEQRTAPSFARLVPSL